MGSQFDPTYRISVSEIVNGTPTVFQTPSITSSALPYSREYAGETASTADEITGLVSGLANPDALSVQLWAKNLPDANRPDDYTWTLWEGSTTTPDATGAWSVPVVVSAPDFIAIVTTADFSNPDPSTPPTPEAYPGSVLLYSELPPYLGLWFHGHSIFTSQNVGPGTAIADHGRYEVGPYGVNNDAIKTQIDPAKAADAQTLYVTLEQPCRYGYSCSFDMQSSHPEDASRFLCLGFYTFDNDSFCFIAVMDRYAQQAFGFKAVPLGTTGYGGKDYIIDCQLLMLPDGVRFSVFAVDEKNNPLTDFINAMEKTLVTLVEDAVSIAVDMI